MTKIHTPRAIALDLDLTIHDVIDHYDNTVMETLKRFNHPGISIEELQAKVETTHSIHDILAHFLAKDILNEAVQYYIEHFANISFTKNSILPGAKELLHLLKDRFNLPIIGITNSDEILAHKILHDLDLFRWFDYVIGLKDGYLPKPDSKMLLNALENIKTESGPHVWFIGDRASDTLCAKQTNCTAIRFYNKVKPIDNNAELFVNSHYHLFHIIKSKLE
ncbi:MAG: HAD-IA family hydrolase [Pseudomonadota bacterium]